MGASACCYFSYLRDHLCYLLHSPFFVITPIASYTTSSSQILSTRLVQPAPHPHAFLLHSHHTSSCQPRFRPPSTSTRSRKPLLTDPFYGREEMTKICARIIRHVFNCPPDSNQPCKFIFQSSCSTSQLNISPTVPINRKPTESTIPLPKFIAYAFHCTCLPPSVAYHSLFLLSRLKSRYLTALYAFSQLLFLTSYMLSLMAICDDTYSNKASVSCLKNRMRNNN